MPVLAQSPPDGVCDRTEEIRDAIVSAVTGVTECAEITETQLGQITTLTLFGSSITALAADDLLGLSGLVKLNLAYNDLTTLPSMVFDDLASLDTLWLNNNQLQTLPAGIFAGLTGLDDLRLASNPGIPFGPVAEAGPTFFVSTDAAVTLQGSGGSDPWGRSVTYAWAQSDSSGVVVSLDGYTTATPSLTAPAVEQETVFRFKLTATAVNPGGVAPPGTTTAGDSATDSTQVRVRAAVPVSVYFHQATYVATEGGSAATVAIRLDQIPRRSVSIPLKAVAAGGADTADYSIPANVTFGYVDRVKYVTVTATDDSVDDDGESLTLSFGESLPAAVARGSPSSVTVDLADNDEPVSVRISGLSVTSDPGTDSVYVIGDTLEVTATFSETVMVSGQPQLTLSVGTRITELLGQAARNAAYVRGSGTTQLAFAYRVVAGDNDPDGVSVATGSLNLNSGSIQDRDSTDAVLAHDGLAVQRGHRVDALAPTLGEAFVDGSRLTLRYSEPLGEDSVPPPTAFNVSVGGASRTVSDVGVSGRLVNVTLATAVEPGEEASVGYTLPATGRIRDKVGIAATAFSNQSATNYTLPTVSIAAVDPNVYEGVDVDFTLTRNGPADGSLQATVRVQDSGDVLLGTSGDRNVTFAAGNSAAWLTLTTHDDQGYEAHATVSATAIGGGAYHVSETAGTASVTVSDNDLPEIDVTLSAPDSVAEDVDAFVVQVSAKTVSDEEPHGSLSVLLRSSDSTANAGSDYSSLSENVRFLPADFTRIEEGGDGRYVATASQAVTIFDDSMREDDETFALELTRSVIIGEDVNLPLEPLVVIIMDNDTLPPPGKVSGLSVTEGDAQLALSWSAVGGATGYKVQWKSGTQTFADAATDGRQHVISSGTTTAYTITGLTNSTPYTVRVIATNSVGDGPASDEKTGTPGELATRPGGVSGLSVTEGNAQLALSWSAVGGATGYKVQWKSGTQTFADAATDGRQHVISSGTMTAYTITGLTNGTPYTVRVIATNSVGDGPASDEKTGTPAAPLATPGLRVTTLAMSLREGDSNTYGVALKSAPEGSVTVTVGGWPGTDVQVEPTSLVFTTSDWEALQTVTVTARQDDRYESTHEVTLTHNSGAGVAGPRVKVTVVDDDGSLPSVSLRALSDSVKEGEFVWFELTRTPPLDGSLRGGIFVFDLEKGPSSDAMVAFYFQPGDARDRIAYPVKIDTLVTTGRTVKATINPSFDGYEQGSPREATVRVIDRTGSQTSGDMASETGVAFSGAPLKATEGEDITVVVRLSEPAEAGVTIPLAVSGLGGANDEDWDVPSEVAIEEGDSLGAVLISAVDDAEEDPGESFELSFGTLPQGFTAEDPRKVVVDIEDNDQFRMGAEETRGWLARFGRAVSGEAVEAVRERMTAGLRPSAESRMRLGGHDLSAWKAAMFSGGGRAGVAPEPASGRGVTSSRPGSQAREFFGRLLSGTSFSRTGAFGQSASGRWSVWGRGGVSSFGGRDGDLSLNGDVTTVTLGADYGSGRALGGVVLSRSTADGSLASGNDPGGQVETTLTSAYPWMRYALTERISVWGMGGYGAGSMPGSPGDAGAGSDVEMRMGALGAAGQLVSTRALALALSSDAVFTGTSAEGATMPGDVEADVSRIRLMLEGSSSIEVAGGTLRPTFEVGFRQDGGDAETGVGLEAGGGFGYSLPSLGLAVEGRVRGLITHEDDGYDEWGASGSVRIAPDPSGRGLNLNLSPSWGSASSGGARALWSRRDMTGIATRPGGTSGLDNGSVVLDLGYGLAVSRQIIATPYGGTMDGARRLGLSVRTGPSLQMKLEAVEGNGHGGLLLNAAYRPGAFFRLSLAGRRNTTGGMSLGLAGQLGGR